jgi:hypothetical protein
MRYLRMRTGAVLAPTGAVRGSDEDELGPFAVALADIDAVADGQPQWRPFRNLVRRLRNHCPHATMIARARLS